MKFILTAGVTASCQPRPIAAQTRPTAAQTRPFVPNRGKLRSSRTKKCCSVIALHSPAQDEQNIKRPHNQITGICSSVQAQSGIPRPHTQQQDLLPRNHPALFGCRRPFLFSGWWKGPHPSSEATAGDRVPTPMFWWSLVGTVLSARHPQSPVTLWERRPPPLSAHPPPPGRRPLHTPPGSLAAEWDMPRFRTS